MNITVILAVVLVVLGILDIVSTRRAMKNPRVYEANKIVAWLMRHGNLWIAVKLAATVASAWALVAIADAPLMLAALCAIYAWVVRQNFKLAG